MIDAFSRCRATRRIPGHWNRGRDAPIFGGTQYALPQHGPGRTNLGRTQRSAGVCIMSEDQSSNGSGRKSWVEKIGKALGIIEALLLSLDKERGGDLAGNLERLYDYAARTLLKANLENRSDLLKEVSSLLREIKLGWDGIGAHVAP